MLTFSYASQYTYTSLWILLTIHVPIPENTVPIFLGWWCGSLSGVHSRSSLPPTRPPPSSSTISSIRYKLTLDLFKVSPCEVHINWKWVQLLYMDTSLVLLAFYMHYISYQNRRQTLHNAFISRVVEVSQLISRCISRLFFIVVFYSVSVYDACLLLINIEYSTCSKWEKKTNERK